MKYIPGVFLMAFPFILFAQANNEIDMDRFIENHFQIQDEDLNYEDLYETLFQYYTQPIDLNRASTEDLLSLQLLTLSQIEALLKHIQNHGKLISIYELQSIPLFTKDVIESILPFITVNEIEDNRSLWERIKTEKNNYLLLRYGRTFEHQKGFKRNEGNRYLGGPGFLYGRYRLSRNGDFSLGLTFEKDAGEPFVLKDSIHLFDFYSYHAAVENKGIIKSLIIGDFRAQFGQGLVMGSGFGFGKGAETVFSTRRNSIGIRPYTSAVEAGFFRGSGLTIKVDRFSSTLIYSRLNQDARLINDSTYSDYEEYASSIQSTGFHRTPSELSSKNQLTEQVFGSILQYNSRKFYLGTTLLINQFSTPILKKPNTYNQFEFKGNQNIVGSIYSSYLWQNLNFFGEFARSKSGGSGIYGGVIASLTPEIDLSITWRRYDKNFHSFYGNPFGENSRGINENGIYWGVKIRPIKKWEIAAYYDHFHFPWLKFGVNAPSSGYEYLGKVTFKASRNKQFYIQFREESKGKTINIDDSNLEQMEDATKKNVILNADYELGNLDLKTRIQGSFYQLGNQQSSGIAFIHDLGYTVWKLKIDVRLALFDTDYENRQYAYEKDVLYAFSIPAYQGIGIRTYSVLKYKVNNTMSFWLKYAKTQVNASTIGSGLSQIDGPRRTDLKAMLKINF